MQIFLRWEESRGDVDVVMLMSLTTYLLTLGYPTPSIVFISISFTNMDGIVYCGFPHSLSSAACNKDRRGCIRNTDYVRFVQPLLQLLSAARERARKATIPWQCQNGHKQSRAPNSNAFRPRLTSAPLPPNGERERADFLHCTVAACPPAPCRAGGSVGRSGGLR